MDINLIIILAFIAYLIAVAATVLSGKKGSEAPPVIYVQPSSPTQIQQATTQPSKPKTYRYTILATSNPLPLRSFIKQLEKNNIDYTLTQKPKTPPEITFVTNKTLQNLEELKKKGIIIDAKIEELKAEEEKQTA